MAKVRYGRTINLGNYESAHFELEIETEHPIEWTEAHVTGLVEGWIERYKTDRQFFKRVLAEAPINVKSGSGGI